MVENETLILFLYSSQARLLGKLNVSEKRKMISATLKSLALRTVAPDINSDVNHR